MFRFDPPQPGQGSGGVEPEDPYAPTPLTTPRSGQQDDPPFVQQHSYPPSPGTPGNHKHPRGRSALIMGILGVCGLPLFGPVAWVTANSALREVRQSPYPVSNRGTLESARVLGIIGTCILLIPVALTALFFMALILLA